MLKQWSYLSNSFITVTVGSYRKMHQIGDYTAAALAAGASAPNADPVLNDLLNELGPLVEAYEGAYITWVNQQGMQKSQTQSLKELLNTLGNTNIQDWDLAIQNVYRQNTPQYTALLPHHRTPFQTGSQQQRITAVGTLSLAIGSDAALQTLKGEVNTVYDTLVTANFTQKGSKSTKSGSSTELEADRIALGIGLYGVLGGLMHLYKETPEAIANYFLVEELRNREQTSFRHDINGGETLLVFARTFENGEEIKLINRGNTALQVARVHQKSDDMPATAFNLPANQEETVAPDALGAQDNRFLIVKNMSATEKGAYTIELI